MVLFFTLIGLTWKLVPLCSGLHNKNQDDRRNKQLHVCLKEKQEQQKIMKVVNDLSTVQERIYYIFL